MRLIALTLLMFLASPITAEAAKKPKWVPSKAIHWAECKVEGALKATEKKGEYLLLAKRAKVVKGPDFGSEDSKDQTCLHGDGKTPKKIKVRGSIKQGNSVILRYRYYMIVDEKGLTEGESWTAY